MNRLDFLKLMGILPLATCGMKINDLSKISENLPTTEKMPVLFLGHGSPMNAIEENEFVKGFREIGKTIPTPTAILCISAHWFTRGTKVTAMEMPQTIHDFGGFPQALFDVQYPAKGSPIIAKETKSLLSPITVELDDKWGLDHGAWSVIRHLYPDANIPVIQMSIDYTQDAQYHFDLAKKLNALRQKGILIIGSGNIIHNLGMIDFANANKDNYGYDWAVEVRATINKHLLDENYKPLIDYKNQSKAFKLAIPSPDHYLPFIYTLGLKEKSETIQLFNDKLLAGSLSMTSLKIS
ncbi:MAG: dioxygenase extradiol [Bacteroidota bacterium]